MEGVRSGSPRILRIGTRGSKLALAQAREVARLIRFRFPKIRCRTVVVKTEGDEFQSTELFRRGAKGVFTKAIEKKLLAQEVDVAVHSLKDLPTELHKGLMLVAVPKRLDPSDVLLSRKRYSLETLPWGAVVGTGSPRRGRQLLLERPDLEVLRIRGNLHTRVGKVLKGDGLDAVVVARAGLERLRRYKSYTRSVSAQRILPAAGQGALGIQIRRSDMRRLGFLRALNDRRSEVGVMAERIFLKALRGGCRVPVGVLSRVGAGRIRLKGRVFSMKNRDYLEAEVEASVRRFRGAAERLAALLLKKGAARFLKEARQ